MNKLVYFTIIVLVLGTASISMSRNMTTVSASNTHDVATTDVKILHPFNVVPMGWVVDINVTVENLGDNSTKFSVTAYYGDSSIGEHILMLDSDQNATLTFSLNTSKFEICNNSTLSANVTTPDDVMGNNFFNGSFVKIIPFTLGDVTGNGKVDIYDVSTMAIIYGCQEDQPEWNPYADTAPPWGYINIYDFCTILPNYGYDYWEEEPC